jgi:hypothetical protein
MVMSKFSHVTRLTLAWENVYEGLHLCCALTEKGGLREIGSGGKDCSTLPVPLLVEAVRKTLVSGNVRSML